MIVTKDSFHKGESDIWVLTFILPDGLSHNHVMHLDMGVVCRLDFAHQLDRDLAMLLLVVLEIEAGNPQLILLRVRKGVDRRVK